MSDYFTGETPQQQEAARKRAQELGFQPPVEGASGLPFTSWQAEDPWEREQKKLLLMAELRRQEQAQSADQQIRVAQVLRPGPRPSPWDKVFDFALGHQEGGCVTFQRVVVIGVAGIAAKVLYDALKKRFG